MILPICLDKLTGKRIDDFKDYLERQEGALDCPIPAKGSVARSAADCTVSFGRCEGSKSNRCGLAGPGFASSPAREGVGNVGTHTAFRRVVSGVL